MAHSESHSPNPAVALLERERDALRATVNDLEASLRQQRMALKAMEDAIARLSGEPFLAPLPTAVGAGLPKLRELVVDVLRAAPSGSKTADIVEALKNMGRPTDPNSVLSTLSRLKSETPPPIYKHADGKWYATPPAPDPISALV